MIEYVTIDQAAELDAQAAERDSAAAAPLCSGSQTAISCRPLHGAA